MNWLKHRLTLYSIRKANEIDKLSRNLSKKYKDELAYNAEVFRLEWKRLQLAFVLILMGEKR